MLESSGCSAQESDQIEQFENFVVVQKTTRLAEPTAPLLAQRFGTADRPSGPPGAAQIEVHTIAAPPPPACLLKDRGCGAPVTEARKLQGGHKSWANLRP
jgi:hypothetical protein